MTVHPREETRRDLLTSPSAVPAGAVILGVDPSVTDAVLDWAADHALAESRPLVLAHATGPKWADGVVLDVDRLRADLLQVGANALDQAHRRVGSRTKGRLQVERLVATAEPADLLVELSGRASVLVLGSHGRGPVGRLLLGSVGIRVAQSATCPVLVHRATRRGLVRQGVLVGIDATARSRATLEVAFGIASTHKLPLTIVHASSHGEGAFTPPHAMAGAALSRLDDERLEIAESIAGLREDHPDVHTTVRVVLGRPDDTLADLAGRMDLVVVGLHEGRRWHFLAGTAISVLEHSTCPVLVVPGASHVRPGPEA
jgi:nucleotide-binding universal stress UspA family protein